MAREICAVVLLIAVTVSYIQAVPTSPIQRCGACMENLSGFRDALMEHMTKEDLSDLSEMCDIFSDDSQDACRSLLTPRPLPGSEMLLAVLCDAASMCSDPSEEQPDEETMYFQSEQDFRSEPEVDFEVEEEEKEVGGVFLCSICQKVMRIGHSFMANRARRARVLRLIKAMCKFVPFFRNQCSNLVQRYGSLLLDLLANFVNPQLCKTVGLCRRAGGSDDFYKLITY